MKTEIRLCHVVTLIVCVIFVAISQSLCLKANIGVIACWDSVSMNVYELTGIKVGTVAIIINFCMILLQVMVQKRDFNWIKLLQVPLCIIAGVVTNIMYYNIFTFEVEAYYMKVILLIIAYVGLAVFIGCMTLLDIITMPGESLCYAIEAKTGFAFAKGRMTIDVICIAVSLALSYIFGLSLKIREGTIIGFIIVGPLMGLMIKLERKIPFIKKMLNN